MVFQIGTVIFRGNGGPSISDYTLKSEASLAEKGLIGGLPGDEWTGWKGEMTVTGTVLPFHLGGLGDMADLHSWVRSGTKVPVIRGDGTFLGWYAVVSVQERHGHLSRSGVGYEVAWDVSLKLQSKPDRASILSMQSVVSNLTERIVLATSDALSSITSLFG